MVETLLYNQLFSLTIRMIITLFDILVAIKNHSRMQTEATSVAICNCLMLLSVSVIVDKNCCRANIVGENSVGKICVDDFNGT